ncbi:MAG: hypothetical protein BGO96_10100 [Micrococcales bacterium 73-15]|nr:MAG: hypothetical protein BGO96_10100 [Micrococcales bacterium 73-15]
MVCSPQSSRSPASSAVASPSEGGCGVVKGAPRIAPSDESTPSDPGSLIQVASYGSRTCELRDRSSHPGNQPQPTEPSRSPVA